MSRLPNSTRLWKSDSGTRDCSEQFGQSEQPSPDPVSRTAAPQTTITTSHPTVNHVNLA